MSTPGCLQTIDHNSKTMVLFKKLLSHMFTEYETSYSPVVDIGGKETYVNVTGLTGESTRIRYTPFMTVDDLKNHIYHELGIKISQQTLLYEDKEILDAIVDTPLDPEEICTLLEAVEKKKKTLANIDEQILNTVDSEGITDEIIETDEYYLEELSIQESGHNEYMYQPSTANYTANFVASVKKDFGKNRSQGKTSKYQGMKKTN
ncbi:unnamed protein product [Mytilus edulis]|uniref:Ubiquitin-like domain-containing protein n=1 Tax=Mytilus edulis TaxID=6550 RepID=A0A8S3S2P9_MYTED|nr:unnamed protein product [Mytilus edulis]